MNDCNENYRNSDKHLAYSQTQFYAGKNQIMNFNQIDIHVNIGSNLLPDLKIGDPTYKLEAVDFLK